MVSPADNQPQNAFGELILAGTWLTCAVAMALPLTLGWGYRFAGNAGIWASAIAAGLCWLASIVALVVRTRFPKPQEVVVGTLGAMLVRMVMILGGGMMIGSASPELVKAAFFGQVIVYFLLTLAVETLLAVRWVKSLETQALKIQSSEHSSRPETGAKAV